MKLIHPGIFQNNKGIEAYFSESNRQLGAPQDRIKGLNLGRNTEDKPGSFENNIKTLFGHLHWNPDCLASAGQVHGTHIQIVDSGGIYEATDGLVTKEKGLALGIQVADCAAVLVADPVSQVIGAFHAGWKGAAGGIIPEGIKKMGSLSAHTSNFLVYISPCISKNNFEVGDEVASQFPEEFVDRGNYNKPHVDLKGFIAYQFISAGVPKSQIDISAECTVQNHRFYSYRREKMKAGRMLALIKMQ